MSELCPKKKMEVCSHTQNKIYLVNTKSDTIAIDRDKSFSSRLQNWENGKREENCILRKIATTQIRQD